MRGAYHFFDATVSGVDPGQLLPRGRGHDRAGRPAAHARHRVPRVGRERLPRQRQLGGGARLADHAGDERLPHDGEDRHRPDAHRLLVRLVVLRQRRRHDGARELPALDRRLQRHELLRRADAVDRGHDLAVRLVGHRRRASTSTTTTSSGRRRSSRRSPPTAASPSTAARGTRGTDYGTCTVTATGEMGVCIDTAAVRERGRDVDGRLLPRSGQHPVLHGHQGQGRRGGRRERRAASTTAAAAATVARPQRAGSRRAATPAKARTAARATATRRPDRARAARAAAARAPCREVPPRGRGCSPRSMLALTCATRRQRAKRRG